VATADAAAAKDNADIAATAIVFSFCSLQCIRILSSENKNKKVESREFASLDGGRLVTARPATGGWLYRDKEGMAVTMARAAWTIVVIATCMVRAPPCPTLDRGGVVGVSRSQQLLAWKGSACGVASGVCACMDVICGDISPP
jgi:hypothetical protein